MIVPLLDLKREYTEIADELDEQIHQVFADMQLLKGRNLAKFESSMATYLGVNHVIGVASGTDALVLSLKAIDIRERQVIIQANTFAAQVEAIVNAGGIPVPIDIDPYTYGPDLDSLRKALNSTTQAMIVTHMYGLPVDLTEIKPMLNEYGTYLIEDCSHAHGALSDADGARVGAIGHIAAFSCGPVKNLACYGDGGFVATSSEMLATYVRIAQHHGQANKNEHTMLGMNSRLDEIQAAVLNVKLKHLSRRNLARFKNACYYNEVLSGIVTTPRWQKGGFPVFHQYVIRSPKRDALAEYLRSQGISTGIHYPVPVHNQYTWRSRWSRQHPSLPNAEKTADEILSIPVHPDLTDAERRYVAASIATFFNQKIRE
jgi:dTDP-4-amino-4,6-dideoxygalactose transaminase